MKQKNKKKRTMSGTSEDPPLKKSNKLSTSLNGNQNVVESHENQVNENYPTSRGGATVTNNEDSQSNENEDTPLKSSQQDIPSSQRKRGTNRNTNTPSSKYGCFLVFSSLRQIFEKNNNRMNLDQIVAAILENPKIREQIPPSVEPKKFVQLALNFLYHPQLPPHLAVLV
jgi:hypothetical protein